MAIRFHVEPRDAPAAMAARKLGLTEVRFNECLPDLLARGFPSPDPTTGHFDLKAIDAWQDRRSGLAIAIPETMAKDATSVVGARLAGMGRG